MRIHSRIILLAGLLTLTVLSAYSSTLSVVFYDNRYGTLNDATGVYTNMGTLPISASAVLMRSREKWPNRVLPTRISLPGGRMPTGAFPALLRPRLNTRLCHSLLQP